MRVSPFVGINNLFDESYNSNIRINAFGARYYEPAPDRNFYGGVTLTFEFD
jgi:iron complex outermembrane receptor protein